MIAVDSIPSKRSGHSMIQHDNKLIVFGGFGEIVYSKNDLWAFDFGKNTWLMVENSSIKQKDA